MSHKKFQHFINWFGIFIRAKTNMQKNKGKIKQKFKKKNLPIAQAELAQPAHPAHQGHGGLLPRPAHPSCSVECHRASRAAATPPACLEASPASLSRPGNAPECPPSIPPLPEPPPPLSPPIRPRRSPVEPPLSHRRRE